MAKITMLSGLPASGKTTKTQELLKTSGNAVRLNKDLLRTMLHFDKFTGVNEGNTIAAEIALADYFLKKGISVIVDDTNLGESHLSRWKNVASETDSKFEHIRVDTPWFVCVERDAMREKQVGVTVIKNMALQYQQVVAPAAGYVLCDLDGTLADITHRLHHLHKEADKDFNYQGKDWKSFFEGIPNDQLNTKTVELLIPYMEKGCEVIFLSARPEQHRKATVDWLLANGITFGWTLLMRPANDKRPDEDVKREILHRYFPDKSVIKVVVDDRPRVIRMWQSEGLEVIDVGKGIEF